MSNITDAARNLPSDPKYALAIFINRVFGLCNCKEENLEADDAEFIIAFTLKFSRNFSISIEVDDAIVHKYTHLSIQKRAISLIKSIRDDKDKLLSDKISSDVDDVIADFVAQRDDTFGLARLNEEERAKIHNQINNIRKIIGESILSDRKKNVLYERLNRLASEVDAHGTRTERFFAFMGDLAFVVGDMADHAKPLIKEVKEMMRIVARSRARQEGVSLPPGDDVMLLPPPTDDV